MLKEYDFDAPLEQIQKSLRPYLPSGAILGAVGLLIVGGGLLYALPDGSNEPKATAAADSAPGPLPTLDESFCDKQTWPYIDQRCAARVEAARGSRQVRIVTDKGTSVKTVTPLPIVEKKPAPTPPKPAVAQAAPQIGPAITPVVANAPSEPPRIGAANVSPSPAGSKALASAAVPPASASTAPVSAGVDAIDDTRSKSKRERAAERAEKREAEKAKKREAKRRNIEQDDDGTTLAEAVGSLPEGRSDRSRSRRARAEVPDEVIEAVEAATARDRGRTVSVDSPRGRRIYVVPREDGGW